MDDDGDTSSSAFNESIAGSSNLNGNSAASGAKGNASSQSKEIKLFKKSRKMFFFLSAIVKEYVITTFRNIGALCEKSEGHRIATYLKIATSTTSSRVLSTP